MAQVNKTNVVLVLLQTFQSGDLSKGQKKVLRTLLLSPIKNTHKRQSLMRLYDNPDEDKMSDAMQQFVEECAEVLSPHQMMKAYQDFNDLE